MLLSNKMKVKVMFPSIYKKSEIHTSTESLDSVGMHAGTKCTAAPEAALAYCHNNHTMYESYLDVTNKTEKVTKMYLPQGSPTLSSFNIPHLQ